MAKVTSKLQVTVPKAIADQYGIEPGQELEWLAGGDAIRVVPQRARETRAAQLARRVELFERATERQVQRQAGRRPAASSPADRGWSRDELYERGRAR